MASLPAASLLDLLTSNMGIRRLLTSHSQGPHTVAYMFEPSSPEPLLPGTSLYYLSRSVSGSLVDDARGMSDESGVP